MYFVNQSQGLHVHVVNFTFWLLVYFTDRNIHIMYGRLQKWSLKDGEFIPVMSDARKSTWIKNTYKILTKNISKITMQDNKNSNGNINKLHILQQCTSEYNYCEDWTLCNLQVFELPCLDWPSPPSSSLKIDCLRLWSPWSPTMLPFLLLLAMTPNQPIRVNASITDYHSFQQLIL